MAKRLLFGTDGVRGRANTPPMTADMALRLGTAAGRYFRRDGSNGHRVVIGKDTRLSGYMLETALTAGLTSTGMNVLLLGPVPTPAVGFMSHSMRADLGVMISASHNPAADNGIKLFGPDGFKLSDEAEAEIEALMQGDITLALPENIGRAKRVDEGRLRYVEYVKTTFPRQKKLDGLRVVVDCANGAAYRAAPEVLWELGADVVPIGVRPDGHNINAGVGSTAPEGAVKKLQETQADIALCLDGDADRLIVIDETGHVADGDQVIALLAGRASANSALRHNTVVSTVMSNIALERHLAAKGIALHRTPVGDRYVVEAMRANGFNLGGEPSGHIIMSDYSTTGDGLMAGLQVLAVMVETGKRASDLLRCFQPAPQRLTNVHYEPGTNPLENSATQTAIIEAEAMLAETGRLVIRKSGTEPVIRVMAEAEDKAAMDRAVDHVVDTISRSKE